MRTSRARRGTSQCCSAQSKEISGRWSFRWVSLPIFSPKAIYTCFHDFAWLCFFFLYANVKQILVSVSTTRDSWGVCHTQGSRLLKGDDFQMNLEVDEEFPVDYWTLSICMMGDYLATDVFFLHVFSILQVTAFHVFCPSPLPFGSLSAFLSSTLNNYYLPEGSFVYTLNHCHLAS